ncbi:degenerate transposase [Streptococcus pneumoniae]|nr:degenerate transposase [Streptococcus pneumoniae]VRJ17008.1 degenerate transposase [Streptococcus pneumoniae]
MKSDKTIIRKNHMEQLHFITKLLDIKDPNIKILDIINMDTHKKIIAKLDYEAPSCPDCGSLMKKYDFQKPSKIPYLETTGMPSRILLRKRRFKCYHCSKMMVAETPLVKKNHQIPRIINQKIAQKLIEKISMTDIAHQLPFQLQLSFASSMTFTLSMIFLGFQRLCLGMSMPSLRER